MAVSLEQHSGSIEAFSAKLTVCPSLNIRAGLEFAIHTIRGIL